MPTKDYTVPLSIFRCCKIFKIFIMYIYCSYPFSDLVITDYLLGRNDVKGIRLWLLLKNGRLFNGINLKKAIYKNNGIISIDFI